MPMSWFHICYWIFLGFAVFYPPIFFPLFWFVILPAAAISVKEKDYFFQVSWQAYLGCSLAVLVIAIATGWLPDCPFRKKKKQTNNDEPRIELNGLDFYYKTSVRSEAHNEGTICAVKTQEKIIDQEQNLFVNSIEVKEIEEQPNFTTIDNSLKNFVIDSNSETESYDTSSTIALCANAAKPKFKFERGEANSRFTTFKQPKGASLAPHQPVSSTRSLNTAAEVPIDVKFATVQRLSSWSCSSAGPVSGSEDDRNSVFGDKSSVSSRRVSKDMEKPGLKKVQPPVLGEKSKAGAKELLTLDELKDLEEHAVEEEQENVMTRDRTVSPYASSRISMIANNFRKSFRKSFRKGEPTATLVAPEFLYRSLSDGTLNVDQDSKHQNPTSSTKSEIDLFSELDILEDSLKMITKEVADIGAKQEAAAGASSNTAATKF